MVNTVVLVSVIVFLPWMTSSAGVVLAGSDGSSPRHCPDALATVAIVWPANVTEIFSPASAVPQTGMGLSR